MSVYCKECVNFDPGESIPHPFGPPDWIQELCNAPENFKDNYKGVSSDRISTPKIINRRNNCTWFDSVNVSSSSSGNNPEEPETSSSSSIN